MATTRDRRAILACATAALTAFLPAAGCRGDRTDKPPRQFFPDMDDQPKWDPQESTDFFVDGRTLRPSVPGTVAFGSTPIDPGAFADAPWAMGLMEERADLLAEDDAVYRGKALNESGQEENVCFMPVAVSRDLLEHGQERYNIYCAACHGFEGDGRGMVGQKWSYAPANISEGVYADRDQPKGTDGHLFDVVRNGVWDPATGANRMPGYRHALSERDAWAVVAYVRALQSVKQGSVDDLDEAGRARLGVSTAGGAQ